MTSTRLIAAALLLALSAPALGQTPPAGYPAEYSQTIEAANKEGGLLIYTNMAEYNWQPVIEGFLKLYPGIKIQTLNMGSELFERYYAEKASNARTADLIVTSSVDNWLAFVDRKEVANYASPEAPKVPEWSRPFPGLYTISTDPIVIAYNKRIVPPEKAPKSIAEIATFFEANPRLKNKLTTYNAPANSFGYSIYWSWMQRNPEGWAVFDKVGPATRAERSTSPMLDKMITGEYALGWFVSSVNIFPRKDETAFKALIGWNFMTDGTPLFLRGMAVTQGATSPATAKLMLDYALSHAGQVQVAKGGLTPYREDVKPSEVPDFTYRSVLDAVGENNVVLVTYSRDAEKQRDEFLARWRKAFSQTR